MGACSNPLATEVDRARKAIEEAEAAEAGDYAADLLAEARARMDSALTEIDEQNAVFILYRNYDTAAGLLAETTARAEGARQAARADKTRIVLEVALAIRRTTFSLNSNPRVRPVSAGGETGGALSVIPDDLDTLYDQVGAATRLAASGRYREARSALTEAYGPVDDPAVSE
jgi:hypothetical protein